MKLRRERFVSEFLDPRVEFAPARVPVDVRWDPLTGESSRLLPEGSIPSPARHDLERLAEETRVGCPFCRDALEESTPRFPPDVWPEGRIRRGEAVLFPNLVPYAKWSSVSVYSPDRHLLPIEEITTSLLADNLAAHVSFARAVVARDPSAGWISINANQLPPAGSSVFHPHLQGSAHPTPSTRQRVFADLPAGAVAEYVELERREGERHVASAGGVDWFAAFAPIGPADVRAIVWETASPAELSEAGTVEVARGVVNVLRVYAELGFQSFNLAAYGAPGGHMIVHLVARAYFGPLQRSDAMWSERLHGEAAVDISPERVAQMLRDRFTSQA